MARCSRAEWQNGFADEVIYEAAVHYASRPAQLRLAAIRTCAAQRLRVPDREVDLKGVHAVIIFPYRRN